MSSGHAFGTISRPLQSRCGLDVDPAFADILTKSKQDPDHQKQQSIRVVEAKANRAARLDAALD